MTIRYGSEMEPVCFVANCGRSARWRPFLTLPYGEECAIMTRLMCDRHRRRARPSTLFDLPDFAELVRSQYHDCNLMLVAEHSVLHFERVSFN